MRRAIRRAGLALVAAGTLGLTQPARADSPPPFAGPPQVVGEEMVGPVVVAESRASPRRGEPVEGRDRFLAFKAELALLADPVTFPYHLTPEVVGDSLTLKGYVLSEAARQRVLQVVHEATGLAVNDQLQTHPGLVLPATGVSEGELQTGVLASLKKEFPEHGRFFGVQVGPHGQVTLTGTISSYEEKAAVSRSLRLVEGCHAVVNKLQVPTVFQKGRFVAVLSADGSQVVAAEALGEEAPLHLPTAPGGQAEKGPKAEAQAVALGPNVEPVATYPPGEKTNKSTGWTVSSSPQEIHSLPDKEPVGATTFSAAKMSGGPEEGSSQDSQGPSPDKAVSAPAVKAESSGWAPHPDILPPSSLSQPPANPYPVAPPSPGPAKLPNLPALPTPPVQAPGPLPASPSGLQKASYHPDAAETRPAEGKTPASAPLPASTWSQAQPQPVTTVHQGMVTSTADSGMVAVSPMPALPDSSGGQPQAGKAVQPEPEAGAADAGTSSVPPLPAVNPNAFAPHETSGVITFKEGDKEEPPPGKVVPGSLQDQLQKRIIAACDDLAPEAEVVVRSPKNLLVKLRILNRADAKQLSRRVLALKELAPYQVDLEIRLGSQPLAGKEAQSEPVAGAADAGSASTVSLPATLEKHGKRNTFVPYVTTGVVIFADDDPADTPPGKVVPGSLQDQLQKRIVAACDGLAPEVEVVVRSPKNLLVRLRVLDRADAERLSKKVMALKELRPYQLDLEVRLARK